MKQTLINILVILAIVGVTFGATRQWFPKTQQVVQTDTTYVPQIYEVEKIVEKTKPVKVVEYKRDTVTVEKVKLERDTVYVSTKDNTYQYVSSFLSSYPDSPRFLGLQHEKPELKITYQKPDGNVRSKIWDVGNKNYEIGLDGSQPNIRTYSSSPQFEHSIEAGYIRFFQYGSPYLQVSTEFRILGIDAVGTANLNRNPYGKIGVKHEF